MLNEADTRAKLIDPAIHRLGWTEEHIRREETAGGVEIIDGQPRRRSRGRIDYTLRIRVLPDTQPVAVALLEAKPEDKPPGHGLEQAKRYASRGKIFHVPFVYSSNGHMFVEYDHFTGRTAAPRLISEFPTPDELRTRYEAGVGFSLESEQAKPLLARYPGGEGTRRYYQDAAIRAVLEKIARGEKRALLGLATGSGKTRLAVWLLRRIADVGQLRKALFVCDRDELRSQGLGAFQAVFGSNAAAVSSAKPQKNARILIATYQTLDVSTEDSDASFLLKNYPENYFSHIVIDECHRSAWGKWSIVLKHNPDAVQIGLTATPRRFPVTVRTKQAEDDLQIQRDNIAHFGEPAYEYDMAQGIEDGYLAACEIIRRDINLDQTGITIDDILKREPRDAVTGRLVTREQLQQRYEKTSFENRIMLPDRVMVMCRDLFDHLVATGGPEQKTIIFCVRDTHADEVAWMMNNLYADYCTKSGRQRLDPYAFKCTAASGGGDYVADLRGAARSYFIATTCDLLSTGVDVPCVRNIVFFKYVESPLAFYQMVGRGTRIHVPSGKLMFRICDYTDATRLFGKEFIGQVRKPGEPKTPPPPPEHPIIVAGFDVRVTSAGNYILTKVDGKDACVTVEQWKDMLAEKLIAEAATLGDFRSLWTVPPRRRILIDHLPEDGRGVDLVQKLTNMKPYDHFDVLGEIGYELQPKTRIERANAFEYKHDGWLADLPPETAAVIRAMAQQFARGGTDALESPEIFATPDVRAAGGLQALKTLGKPADILRQVKERMFAA